MKVILTEKVPSLGNIGEIVNVSAGYARNFLIPKQFAMLADSSNKAQMEHMDRVLAKKVQAQKDEALGLKKKIDGLTLGMIKRVGASGKIFGSVTNADLAKELGAKGVEVERRILVIDTPIKGIGTFTVKAKLFSEVEAEFKVKVEMDPKQVEELKLKAEAAAKRKKEKAEAAAAGEGEESTEEAPVELTDEQKLAKEADELLRG
jgi:large subunit ribosomal protein L9